MLNRLEFSVVINAEKDVVWKALWDENSYRDWAGVFFKGSYMVADSMEKGSKVHFLGPDKNGIYSIIEEHIPSELIKFKHIGSVVNGEEQALDSETKSWSGANETYSISEQNNTCKLQIQIDVMDEHLDFMTMTFPKALARIKENCS